MSDNRELPLVEPLSERERAILRLLADGLTNHEIADHLYLSYETVKWYTKQIYGKLGVGNRTKAASVARELGLLDGVALVASAPLKDNLPAPITLFIGRDQQIEEIVRLIRDKSMRLISLTGPGGIGKTRLALEVAAGLSAEFPDGIYFVNLWPTNRPERVAETIATTLGLEVSSENKAVKALTRYFPGRQMLLIIDNFEHVLRAAPLLVDLLAAAAELRLIVTSREPLQVYGEVDYPVPPLSLPDSSQHKTADDYLGYESIALFAQRAIASRPRFRITNQNVKPVADICIRLDGLPLAIELAAARVKHLAPDELLKQLDGSLAALKSAPRGVPERHRTLQATITWSYNLLEDAEQALFASLSVFLGGFNLGAAEHVAGGHVPAGMEDGLESLANKNLLVQQDRIGEAPRFMILKTIHAYAQERLREGNEEEACRRRHAEYFVGLAERARPKLRGTDLGFWYGRIDADKENIRSALTWSLEGGDWELGLRLVAALDTYWFYRGPSIDSLRWVELAMEHLEQAPPALRAGVEICAGHTLMQLGDSDRARAPLADALTIYRELGDVRNAAWALASLSFASVGQAEAYQQALAECEEGLSLFRELGDKPFLAAGLTIKGSLARAVEDLDVAEQAYKEALDLSRQTGNKRRESIQYVNLGMVEQSRGNYIEAEDYLRRCLKLSGDIGFSHMLAFALAALAGPLGSQGENARAATLLGASSAHLDLLGTVTEAVDRPAIENYTTAVISQLGEEAYELAYSKGRLMDLRDAVAYALGDSAE